MKNIKVHNMTLDAIFIALMVVVYFLQLGFVRVFPAISITVLHVFVIIVGILGGYKRSLVLGLAFGLISFTEAAIAPKTPVDPLFVNPLVSILPRLLFGFVAGFLGRILIEKYETNNVYLGIYSTIVAIISTLFHTLATVGALYLFEAKGVAEHIGASYFDLIYALLLANGGIEILLAAIIVPAIVVPLYKYSRRFYQTKID